MLKSLNSFKYSVDDNCKAKQIASDASMIVFFIEFVRTTTSIDIVLIRYRINHTKNVVVMV